MAAGVVPTGAESIGSLDAALARTQQLLLADPVLAARQANEILRAAPGHPIATLLLGAALRNAGNGAAALAILEPLARQQPKAAVAHSELGLAYADVGRWDDALRSLQQAVGLKPDLADAWRAIGDEYTRRQDTQAADAAYARHIKAATKDPRLLAAASALVAQQIPTAEALLKQHLWNNPTDVAAIRMLAEVAGRLGRFKDAEALLARCLELAPGFTAARHNYALVLHRQNKAAAALQQIDRLTTDEPHNTGYRNLKAVVLSKIGDYRESIEIYADVVKRMPDQPKIWMSYGHALATAGREEDCIAAYRKSIDLQPGFGEAYWSLANLKTFRFAERDVAAMQQQLARDGLAPDDRFHFEFALGKAHEDRAEYEVSFQHYAAGNRLRRTLIDYDPADITAHVQRSKQQFTAEYFAARADFGATAPDPIFIVGLPRAGSTLIEQILASHSLVEGTAELPDILAMAHALNSRIGPVGRTGPDGGTGPASGTDAAGKPGYPAILADLDALECRRLGQQYLDQTRIQRHTDKPFFVDKMPNNFLHVGLIQQTLPRAKIIDARRHPMACCFSAFKQHFARGQLYTYDLGELGRYYRDYVDLMAHLQRVLPGRIHRVDYEAMIEDTEAEVRRLLEYCGLPHEAQCLRFYENDRAVRTASKQQVRQPIFRDGVDQWRHYEAWLGELREALGEAYLN